jgi:hypothetical protein
MPDPSLVLRRANISRKSGNWQHEDYDVFDGDRDVGRIYFQEVYNGRGLWFWAVSFEVTGCNIFTHAASLDDATAAFKAEYERWRK